MPAAQNGLYSSSFTVPVNFGGALPLYMILEACHVLRRLGGSGSSHVTNGTCDRASNVVCRCEAGMVTCIGEPLDMLHDAFYCYCYYYYGGDDDDCANPHI